MTVATGETQLTLPSDTEIRIERVFAATRDCVWRAFTEPDLIARWWGRGHEVDVVRMELWPGGRWRFIEHGPEGISGFEGRNRDIRPFEGITQTFEWDGMPGYVSLQTASFEETDDGRTRLVVDVFFFSKAERDGMLQSGMEGGMNESYAALDRLLASIC